MKQVNLFVVPNTIMRNSKTISLELNAFFLFSLESSFINSKTPLTDSQNRILDSKPMSMDEFERLMDDMMFLTRKTHNELHKNYNS